MIDTAIASVCRLISGATVEWRCEPDAAVQRIYFGNHTSHLDFVVIWSALPPRIRRRTRPVAGRDYWAQGAARRYLARDIFRAVLIERASAGSETAARASIERMSDEMGEHDSLIVFPEGTRSVCGEIGAFRSGLYHLARARPEVELIPVLSRVTFGPRLAAIAGEPKDAFLARSRASLLQLKATA